jgi:O-antigen ligase
VTQGAVAAQSAFVAPRWLPWLLLGLLLLPFHPYWLDFEQVRRGLLLVVVGIAAAVTASRWQRPDARLVLLAAAMSWPVVGTLLAKESSHLDGEIAVYCVALWICAQVGTTLPIATWSPALPCLLAATSLYGIAQRLGIAEFAGYGAVGEPVSVFGNLNVAAEVTCTGLAACMALGLTKPRWPLLALVVGGAYLPINGSRSSLVALAAVAAWLIFAVPAELPRKLRLLGYLGLGMALGFVIHAVGPAPFRAVEPSAVVQVEARRSTTLEVRSEIAQSCFSMIHDAPLLGRGIGGFAIDYPRYRSQREIELSTFDRQFAACPQTAHNDYLQLAVEGGLPALLLWLFAGLAILRSASARAHLLPLAALLGLACVRAPLWNAPCAALALWFALAPRSDAVPHSHAPAWRRLLGFALGLALVWFGLQPWLANQDAAAYQASRARGGTPDLAALSRAAQHGFTQPKIEQLLAAEYLDRDRATPRADAADPAHTQALAAIQRALDARPNDPALHLRLAEIRIARGETALCKQALQAAAALDHGDPQLQLQLASLAFREGQPDIAVQLLYQDPHWRLLAELAPTLDQFAELTKGAKNPAPHLRYRAEAALRRALDACGQHGEQAQQLALDRFAAAKQACAAAEMPRDPRFLALIALLALDAEDPVQADRAAAALLGKPLEPWQVIALGREPTAASGGGLRGAALRADRLRKLESWRLLLPH